MDEQKRRHPNVANLNELEGTTRSKGERFGSVMKSLGRATGGRGIGCTWYEQPPGKTAFPRHFHCKNEESIFILEGEGTVTIGEEKIPVRASDYVTFPVGPEHAHQVENGGDQPLRYLCFSTLDPVEVVGYPDSGKVAAMAAGSGKGWQDPQWVRMIHAEGTDVDYYHGESTD